MTHTLKSKRGVTLVELLAVIVILGIIAAIAVPAVGGLIDRQRQNAADLSHDSIMGSVRDYVLSNDALAVGDTFTLADLIPLDVAANVYDTYDAANIVFEVQANKTFVILGVIDATQTTGTEISLFIDGKAVEVTEIIVAP